MSNFLSVATVTAAFRRLLLQAVQVDVPGATVSMLRPTEPGGTSGIPQLGVNLFLYEIAPVASLRNEHLPARRSNGAVVHRPAAAFELHYLLSFYGNETNLEPQRLLGSTTARLVAEPLLTRARLTATTADPGTPFLASSDLAEQVDSVKFTPLALSLEEMSRIWSIFFQTRYTLSMAWRASAVVIEPQLVASPSLPAREPHLVAVPIREPHIARVVSSSGEDAAILPGGNIVIQGERLRADLLEIAVGGILTPPVTATDERITAALPANLRPGPQVAQIRHLIALGEPPAPHHGFESNPGAFILHPQIARVGGNYQIVVSNVGGAGTTPRSADIAITLTTSAGRQQQTTLELFSTATAAASAEIVRTFYAAQRATDGPVLAFAVENLPAGAYLARVRVDGAESPFDRDNTSGSPTFGQPIAPSLTVP